MDAFIAMMVAYGFNWAPRSWATCEGQLQQISANPALFSLLGTTYGGDGRTTYALPDLRGRVAVGQGHGPGLSARQIGQQLGTEFNVLNQNQMPAHTHPATGTLHVSSSPADDDTPGSGTSIGAGANAEIYVEAASNAALMPNNVAVTVGPTGGNQSVNNMQPSLVVNWSICTQGIYPSRS